MLRAPQLALALVQQQELETVQARAPLLALLGHTRCCNLPCTQPCAQLPSGMEAFAPSGQAKPQDFASTNTATKGRPSSWRPAKSSPAALCRDLDYSSVARTTAPH